MSSARLRLLAFVPAAVIVAVGAGQSTRAWGDFGGYVEVGEATLRGVYSGDYRNTWPPFFGVLAIPLALLARLPPAFARLCWATLSSAVFAWAMAAFWRRARPARAPWWTAPLATLVIAPFWAFHLRFHQVNTFVVALTVAAFLLAERDRDLWAGVLFGVGAAAKLTPAFALPFFLLRGRFKVVAGAALGLVGCALLVVPFLGADALTAWLTWVERGRTLGGLHEVRNQSVLALFERWFTDIEAPLRAPLTPFFVADRGFVDLAGRAASLALVLAVAFRLARAKARPLDALPAILAASFLAAPYCWRSGYVAFFPLVLVAVARLASGARPAEWLLAAPFLLATLEREPGLVGGRVYTLLEGAGLTAFTALLLVAFGVRAAASESAAAPGSNDAGASSSRSIAVKP